MRRFIAFAAALLAGCSSPSVREEPDDPAALRSMLWSEDPLLREEAAQRLLRLGLKVEQAPPSSEAASPWVASDTDRVRANLERALEERDPQRMVWGSYHALRVGCLARDWKDVSAALDRQGFRLQEIYEPHERSKFVRFTARAAAYVNGAGDKHDLFFWIHAVLRGEPERWIVREVYVGLHATFEMAFKTLAERDRYPSGSVLAQFFELPEVKKLAVAFPILEEIELTYARIRDKDSETAPAGFHLNAGFRTAGEKGGGRGVYYTAESKLDPRETRGGKWLRDGFVPSDVLGPLTPRGSSFWGAGGLRPSDD
jgi:hypothetical protein